jgi:pyridoxamine 5'-phosphate oxidase
VVEAHGEDPPRPPHWGGYRVRPDTFEFWQGRPSRLHDRLRYRRADGHWRIERLAP